MQVSLGTRRLLLACCTPCFTCCSSCRTKSNVPPPGLSGDGAAAAVASAMTTGWPLCMPTVQLPLREP
jgi:hypothetical protein